MRTLMLVGTAHQTAPEVLARRCGWCARWFSTDDYIRAHRDNALVTHGICKPCERKMHAQIDAMPGPDNAA